MKRVLLSTVVWVAVALVVRALVHSVQAAYAVGWGAATFARVACDLMWP